MRESFIRFYGYQVLIDIWDLHCEPCVLQMMIPVSEVITPELSPRLAPSPAYLPIPSGSMVKGQAVGEAPLPAGRQFQCVLDGVAVHLLMFSVIALVLKFP